MLGVLDLGHFTEDAIDSLSICSASDSRFFQMLGLPIQPQSARFALGTIQGRFPGCCVMSPGFTVCIIASFYELLIQQVVLLAMFITVCWRWVESVSTQSMTVTLQALDERVLSWSIFRRFLRRCWQRHCCWGQAALADRNSCICCETAVYPEFGGRLSVSLSILDRLRAGCA